MNMFMKKKNLLVLWIAFIVMVNLAFVMVFAVKTTVLGMILGVLSLALFIFAIACTVRRSNEIKKQSVVNRARAQNKMSDIDELLAKK